MKDVENITQTLKEIKYTTFSKYISDLLSAFNIPQLTIQRLISNGAKDAFKYPLNVYRRGSILWSPDIRDKNSFEKEVHKTPTSSRLFIAINDDLVICKDCVTEDVIEFIPEEIYNHIHFLSPLIFGIENEKDPYASIDFAELIGELFNQLCMDEENSKLNNSSVITDYLLSLIYFGVGHSLLNNKEIKSVVELSKLTDIRDFTSHIKAIFYAVFHNSKQGLLFEKLPFFDICRDSTLLIPRLNKKSFELSLKVMEYDLANIDTEILSSLIYKLVQEDTDVTIYGHSTSYQNVSKVLRPLFINEYEKQIEENATNVKELQRLRKQLLELTFFDPTNGPGCFLTSCLNSIVSLSSAIDKLIGEREKEKIRVNNFVGLVDNALSRNISQLSLWVSYLQYLRSTSNIQLSDLANTYQLINLYVDDQLATDWTSVCPNYGKTLLVGSPQFKGAKKLSSDEKNKMQVVFGVKSLGDSDYCSCWLYLAAKYISGTDSKCAMVLTNSICQGAQVPFVWTRIYNLSCEISFAYRSFKWRNSNKQSTGVSVIIVGISKQNQSAQNKYLYTGDTIIKTNVIGPYLVHSTSTIVEERSTPISKDLPPMHKGNMPYDNQNLLMSSIEKSLLIQAYPDAKVFIKKIVGSDELIKSKSRWCLWIPNSSLDNALKIPPIFERIEKVKKYRLEKRDLGARKLASRSHQFREFRSTLNQTLVIPSVSSENRPYIPIAFIGSDTIVSNLAFAIYECNPWIFGMISSRMHMVWIRTVCGSLETRPRYSSQLGYNTFPFPQISDEKRAELTSYVFDIINERENYCDINLGDLYSDLPQNLKMLHEYLDVCVDTCYQNVPFSNDVERIKHLFDMYEKY